MSLDLEKLRSISVSAKATPSRGGAGRTLQVEETERRWSKDFAAYRRLRKDGLRPRSSDGAAMLEAQADSAAEIEGRKFEDV